MKATDQIKHAAFEKTLDYLLEDPERNATKIMDMLDKVAPADLFPSQRTAFRNAIDQQSNWYQLITRLLELNPVMRNDFIKTFLVDGNLMAWPKQETMREKHRCNVPWAILLDPTSACNLHCKGCWAAEYGNKLNLTYDEIDSIIRQGKEMGTYFYIYTGGEPLVRKKDLIKLCEVHSDAIFMCFTNGTLIDEQFAADMMRVKNFVPVISVEGYEESMDSRRGDGTYQKAVKAMNLLKSHRLPFGNSICYTSVNIKDVSTEAYVDQLVDWGSYFVWYFHYMPVGKDAVPELLPSPEQREHMYHQIRTLRGKKPIFMLDFQNDGEYVGGCIAGGRRYLHINANGDCDPCVFIHYSDSNIREKTLLEALRSPLFMAYHDGQPFNDNHLRPCPMLENPYELGRMVAESGAHGTDLVEPETPEELRCKTLPGAADWKPVAERIWHDEADPMHAKRAEGPRQGMAESDLKRFERLKK